MLSRVFVSLDKVALVRFLSTYRRPIIEYASPMWNLTELSLRVQLKRIHRHFTRRLLGQDISDYDFRLSELEVVSLATRRDFIALTQVFKLLYSLMDTNVSRLNILISHNNIRSYGNNIIVNRVGAEYVGWLFTYRIASQWNHLPSSMKTSTS